MVALLEPDIRTKFGIVHGLEFNLLTPTKAFCESTSENDKKYKRSSCQRCSSRALGKYKCPKIKGYKLVLSRKKRCRSRRRFYEII